jgi:hypothetical protein
MVWTKLYWIGKRYGDRNIEIKIIYQTSNFIEWGTLSLARDHQRLQGEFFKEFVISRFTDI